MEVTSRVEQLTGAVELQAYQQRAEAFWQAETRCLYRGAAGLTPDLDLAKVYQEYGDLFSRETVLALIGSTSAQPAVRSLAAYAAFRYLQGSIAAQDDEIFGRMASSKLNVEGEEIPFFAADRMMANEGGVLKRRAIYEARRQVVQRDNPLRKQRWEQMQALANDLGFDNYGELCDRLKGLQLYPLYLMAAEILEETEAMYRAQLPAFARQVVGPDKLQSADVYYLMRGKAYYPLFPPSGLKEAVYSTARDLGFDLDQIQGLEFDAEPRPQKSPRPFTAYVRVPDEIKLVINPVGGYSDYIFSLHELGHSLMGIAIDPQLPFINRYMGDDTVGEVFAFLFEDLARTEAWVSERVHGLQTYLYLQHANFIHLMSIRRCAAKFMFEYEYHTGALEGDPAERYSEVLSGRLQIYIPPDFYLIDMDDGFYSAQYLRAWILVAQLREYLQASFGANWFKNRDCGAYLRELWRAGQPEYGEDLAIRIGCDGLDTRALIRSLNSR